MCDGLSVENPLFFSKWYSQSFKNISYEKFRVSTLYFVLLFCDLVKRGLSMHYNDLKRTFVLCYRIGYLFENLCNRSSSFDCFIFYTDFLMIKGFFSERLIGITENGFFL